MEIAALLSDFPSIQTEEWERAIRDSVAGPDYPAKLIWHPEEGLAVKPYYRAEDTAALKFLDAAPGEFPYVRGIRPAYDWRIREEINGSDLEHANKLAVEAVACGAEEIAFRSPRIENKSDVALLVANLNEIPVHFQSVNRESMQLISAVFRDRAHGASVSADFDPLSDVEFSSELLELNRTGTRLFTISGERYEEHGAGATEQIAFTLSAAVEFLDEVIETGVGIDCAAGNLHFALAIGPEFYIQIAKLRAFRMVWAQVVESFGGSAESAKATIYTRTARWNQTIYDPEVNALRATTEAISAVLGGADSVALTPFDECYREPDAASRRLARNTQLILKEEAGLGRVADPLGGAYLIEVLTHAIATRAWKLFQELESAGGYRKAITDGVIDSVLKNRALSRKDSTNYRRLTLTGTNRFARTTEKICNDLDPSREFELRAARDFEEIRLRTERAASRRALPTILLAKFGDAKMSSARAQFAADFLACAGLPTDGQSFASPLEVSKAAADLIVLCSSDSEYLQFAEELMPMLKQRGSNARVVIAGNPSTIDQLRQLGIIEFIHLRSNAVKLLARLQKLLGIEG